VKTGGEGCIPPSIEPTTPVRLFLVPVADMLNGSSALYTSAQTAPPPTLISLFVSSTNETSFILRRLIVTPSCAFDAPLNGDVPPPSTAK
jgi:hypothetical protein